MGKQRHKQDPNNCPKKEARASQRKVGGRATQRPVGLSNHTWTSDRQHSFALTYDEVRETASIRMTDYQQRAAAHYNRKARPRSLKVVLRKVFENTAETGAGKFQANWEDPYIVSKTSKVEPIIYRS
ncbi:hypothetical protein CK203_050598 [Vitis vinifera]|uniref:Uncharacterized protein n=1 Tax=Vitis vinifera TaxID=29760 RepID=A0A438GFH1_VITVI|nr:hypothetical protein CK203_050598 [Vitis vinifera]